VLLNQGCFDADILTVPPTGERRLLFGLLLAPVLLLDLVAVAAVVVAPTGAERSLQLSLLGLCLVLTMISVAVGPAIVRRVTTAAPTTSGAPGSGDGAEGVGAQASGAAVGAGAAAGEATRSRAAADRAAADRVATDRAAPGSPWAPPVSPVTTAPVTATAMGAPADTSASSSGTAASRSQQPSRRERPVSASGPAAAFVICAGRRQQVLIARQLDCLERLAADTAAVPAARGTLTRLHLLSSRLRRNGESLLLLSGADAGQRSSRARALSGVIEAAREETEQTGRVSVTWAVDLVVRAPAVRPLTHLLAELLECVSGQVPAEVEIDVRAVGEGVRVRITGSAPAPSADEFDQAVRQLRGLDEAVAGDGLRLGAFGFAAAVVGRLARELPCTVELERTPAGGVAVAVDLPPDTFVPNAEAGPAGRVPDPEYAFYADHTDLPEYTAMQGYPDPPGGDPTAYVEVASAVPDESPWFTKPLPEEITEPGYVQDPVASVGPTALDEPFGAGAGPEASPDPLPVGGQRSGWTTPEELHELYDLQYANLRDPSRDRLRRAVRSAMRGPSHGSEQGSSGSTSPTAPARPRGRRAAPEPARVAPQPWSGQPAPGPSAPAMPPAEMPAATTAPAQPEQRFEPRSERRSARPADPSSAQQAVPQTAPQTKGARYPTRAELRRRRRAEELGQPTEPGYGAVPTSRSEPIAPAWPPVGTEAPQVPAQAVAPEDAPGFGQQTPDSAFPGTAFPGTDPVLAAAGSVPVPPAPGATELSGATDPGAPRATHVRSMLAELRAGTDPDRSTSGSADHESVPAPRDPVPGED